jgi:8-hydroxy-5-deazaflavin:NADPH oxidoreductase
MKTAVIGTGPVGRILADKLAEVGHDVVMGTRSPEATLERTGKDAAGNQPFALWHAAHQHLPLVTFAEAGGHGELVVNATAGTVSLEALAAAGPQEEAVLLDVANPLDFSQGSPPSLSIANTDSLAEQLQRAFPQTRVVKALNTMNHQIMTQPGRLSAPHNAFVAGDDEEAKDTVTGLLEEFGWPPENILDLGGLAAARGMEMYLPLWLATMQSIGTADFNIHIVRGAPG